MDHLERDRPYPARRRRHLRPRSGPVAHQGFHRHQHVKHRTRNPYLFRGRLLCGVCKRRIQGQWSHGSAYYRCRFPNEYALANRIQHPRNVYLRESWLIGPLDEWIAKLFSPHRIEETIDLMAAATPPTGHTDKAELYSQLGLQLTYASNKATVLAEITPGVGNSKSPRHTGSRGDLVRVRGGTRTPTPDKGH
ncbi:zinc ribbon domain-containing protein [Streptomyces sp. 3N207]|uniref:zinc ribbon domain-containing protein n=1 Tax=Streptomyces sp. 3N207 TaxID=3457417 RepID=UPI003FD379F7